MASEGSEKEGEEKKERRGGMGSSAKMAATAIVTATVLSPQLRSILRQGAVRGLAGVLVLGDALASFARGVGRGIQDAGGAEPASSAAADAAVAAAQEAARTAQEAALAAQAAAQAAHEASSTPRRKPGRPRPPAPDGGGDANG